MLSRVFALSNIGYLLAGTPWAAKNDTSVQPSFASGASPVRVARAWRSG